MAKDVVVGLVQPVEDRLQEAADAGISAVVLSVVWDRAQPEQGALDVEHVREVQARYRSMREAGLDVVLSPGLQYTPDWVFELSDSTRFVDQHGTTWDGPPGEDTADAVHDGAVRAAQAEYLRLLSEALGRDAFAAVRVGGLLDGELRYPGPRYQGREDRWWGFSRKAQESSPVPGWRPGDPGPEQARAFLEDYLEDLAAYQDFLLAQTAEHFSGDLYVLHPSWGVRPGEVDAAVDGLLDGSSPGERRQTLQLGVDYERLVARATGERVVHYSTWVDAPSQGSSTSDMAPVEFLASLVRERGLRIAGENTGGDGVPALRRAKAQTRELGLVALFWFPGDDLYDGRAPELGDLTG